MFGSSIGFSVPDDQKQDTVESLRQELRDAKAEIERLKLALGGNHKSGYRSGGLFG